MHELLEDALGKALPTSAPSPVFLEGARRALLAPGKRIRPLLTLYTVELLKPEAIPHALTPACALEMVHCYSLIHDDLPCMDNEEMRRGEPTLHRVYNEAIATLVGDFLLTYAFDLLAHAPTLSPSQKVALIQALAKAAGDEGLIGGQVMDLQQHEDILECNRRKTASLFRAALAFGGIIADATEEKMAVLLTFGTTFGELFQGIDDLVDEEVYGTTEAAYERVSLLAQSAYALLQQLPSPSLHKILDQTTQPLSRLSLP